MFRLTSRIFLGFALIVALAGVLVLRVVMDQLKPIVRETIEEVMVDSAHLLADVARSEFESGEFQNQHFGKAVSAYAPREIDATIWKFK